MTTVVLAVCATLLGPLGMVSTASAVNDGEPIVTWKIGDTTSYAAFIREIRRHVGQGHGSSDVPGTSYNVDHTSGAGHPESYLTVRVVAPHNDRSVRLRLRASNLYLVGWWRNSGGRDQYVSVDRGQRQPPVNGRDNERDGVSATFGESYGEIEAATGVSGDRGHIQYGLEAWNNAVETLIRADRRSRPEQARAFLMMTQGISEATRFRPIADLIARSQASHAGGNMPGHYVSMQNRWSELSGRFNKVLGETRKKSNYTDPEPLRQYVSVPRNGGREWEDIAFTTAAIYAKYLLMAALGPVKTPK
ncbi:ribosome-inactivating family protein [Streptomyces sp. NPDC057424]|uniref:ribosome-inactivating family protein n=1 Tax=Streptomyces sp. NPDC057424 TaxID=3346127 RepID=UPI0036BDE346